MKGKNVFIVVFFCLVLIIGSLCAFRVSPVRLDLTISRGKTQKIILNLTGSKGTGREHLFVFPTDIFMKRNGTLNFDRLEGFEHSAVPWIKLEETKMALLERQKKELKFKISVPRRAKPGEYYAVIMVEPTEFTDIRAKDKPFLIHMKSRIAVVIVIDVPGRIYEKKGEVILAKVEQINDEVKIISTFSNTGNIHLDVVGTAFVRSKDGRTTFGQLQLRPTGSSKDEAFIFPGNMRDFEGILERPLFQGEYVVDVVFDYGYKFKKAREKADFFITRKIEVDESKMKFLSVEPSAIELQIPAGGLRTRVVKVTNTDYRPIKVSVISEDEWLNVYPSEFTLRPGERKNLKTVLLVPDDKKEKRTGKVVFKPDRGKPTEVSAVVICPGLALREKVAPTEVEVPTEVGKEPEIEKVVEKPKVIKEKKLVKEEEPEEEPAKEEVVKPEEKPIEEVEEAEPMLEPEENHKALFLGLAVAILVIVILLIILLRVRKAGKVSKN